MLSTNTLSNSMVLKLWQATKPFACSSLSFTAHHLSTWLVQQFADSGRTGKTGTAARLLVVCVTQLQTSRVWCVSASLLIRQGLLKRWGKKIETKGKKRKRKLVCVRRREKKSKEGLVSTAAESVAKESCKPPGVQPHRCCLRRAAVASHAPITYIHVHTWLCNKETWSWPCLWFSYLLSNFVFGPFPCLASDSDTIVACTTRPHDTATSRHMEQ